VWLGEVLRLLGHILVEAFCCSELQPLGDDCSIYRTMQLLAGT